MTHLIDNLVVDCVNSDLTLIHAYTLPLLKY